MANGHEKMFNITNQTIKQRIRVGQSLKEKCSQAMNGWMKRPLSQAARKMQSNNNQITISRPLEGGIYFFDWIPSILARDWGMRPSHKTGRNGSWHNFGGNWHNGPLQNEQCSPSLTQYVLALEMEAPIRKDTYTRILFPAEGSISTTWTSAHNENVAPWRYSQARKPYTATKKS